MAEPSLKATIKITDTFKVGANPQPSNQFTLSVTNSDAPIKWTPANPFRAKFTLGAGKEALFLDKNDARACVVSVPKDWRAEPNFPGGNEAGGEWKIYSNSQSLNKDASLTISFTKVISKTAPEGETILRLESATPAFSQNLPITKTVDKPDFIYFISDPETGVQNLPGDSVTLKWRKYKLTSLELTQIGIANPLVCDFANDEGSQKIPNVSADMRFRLKGYDGPKSIERELTVKVLRAGWYDRRTTVQEGDPGYPSPTNEEDAKVLDSYMGEIPLEPTLLWNANDQGLYAIFRTTFQGREDAFLSQTTNPFGAWNFVPSSVPEQTGKIPAGFSTSPGVYCDDKLWLLGGSQINPDLTSNGVWFFDPKKGRWESAGPALWTPRMGHAVLVFQNKIWVLGGRDEAGNALNEVWTLDVVTRRWSALDKASWAPRCLFTPVVFAEQIWVYGGVPEPFSDKIHDDLYTYVNGNWSKREMTGVITDNVLRKPIASCLQVFNQKLCLFGKFRTISNSDKSEKIEPLAFSLSTPTTKTWDAFPNDGLKRWGPDTTFSYQLVNFKNKLLIARALEYQTPNPVLKVYVPG